jgi:hypothetical protein
MQNCSKTLRSALTEESCLEQLMTLRFGGNELDCSACGHRNRFSPVVKRRAYVCSDCGHALYPALGTPFETLRTSLGDWFIAVHTTRTFKGARELERQAGFTREAAERLERDLSAFARRATAGSPFEGWLAAISTFVETRAGSGRNDMPPLAEHEKPPRAPPPPGKLAQASGPERSNSRHHWPILVMGLAGGFAVAAGVVVALRGFHEPVRETEEVIEPTLSATPPRPSLTLAAIEEDLAAAKAAVEAVAKTPDSVDAPARPVPAPRPEDLKIATSADPNEILTFGPIKVRRHLAETIVRASRVVGADPTLLMAVADKESSFATEVTAKTSSATGLFQFIESTWLGILAEFGKKHGFEREAQMIVRVDNRWTVPNPVERNQILDMRRDPYLAALMAGEMLRRDTLRIERRLGRHLSGGEIYLVHFLGPEGAQTFIDQVEGNPNLVAAELLPKPAEANKSIFFDRDGGKTVSEVHRQFEQMISTRLNRYQEVRRLGGALTPINSTR